MNKKIIVLLFLCKCDKRVRYTLENDYDTIIRHLTTLFEDHNM